MVAALSIVLLWDESKLHLGVTEMDKRHINGGTGTITMCYTIIE